MPTPDQGPFSQLSRLALIEDYFADRLVSPGDAWKDVYRLLLWADPTTGLAHCYESDKAQPGRPWYARTLAFHAWLADQFGLQLDELADQLDWMFRQVITRVARDEADRRTRLGVRAQAQRSNYPSTMPEPGDDPELRQIIEPLLPQDPARRPDDEIVRDILRQVRVYLGSENKRKNLLGRGFEDVLGGVVSRLAGGPPPASGIQTPIEEIRGFRPPRSGDKTEKVDFWVGPADGRRILVSAKWSVRADREKQMRGDFLTYVACNEIREPFEYVWITNEFDPARLVANATNTEANRYLFDAVVHVCPEALEVVHDLDRPSLPHTLAELKDALERQRITGLGVWLTSISARLALARTADAIAARSPPAARVPRSATRASPHLRALRCGAGLVRHSCDLRDPVVAVGDRPAADRGRDSHARNTRRRTLRHAAG